MMLMNAARSAKRIVVSGGSCWLLDLLINFHNCALIRTCAAFEVQGGVVDTKAVFEFLLYPGTDCIAGTDQLILHDDVCT